MEQTKERKYFWISRAYDDGDACDDCEHKWTDYDGVGRDYRMCAILESDTKRMDCAAYLPHTVYVEREDGSTETFECEAVDHDHAIELWGAAGGKAGDEDIVDAEAK